MSSHKKLKSVSHNFSHSFLSLMNFSGNDYFLSHLLKQCRKTGLDKIEIDVLNKTAKPVELLTHTISKSIGYWNESFPKLVKDSGSSMDFIKSADMKIEFDLTKERPYQGLKKHIESPFVCIMTIVDDNSKNHERRHEGWWYPENDKKWWQF